LHHIFTSYCTAQSNSVSGEKNTTFPSGIRANFVRPAAP